MERRSNAYATLPEEPSLSVEEFSRYWKIDPKTYYSWEGRGLAPRRLRLGQRRHLRIPVRELDLWVAQWEADRARIASPHLKHPVEPLSWLTADERAAGLKGALPTRRTAASLARRYETDQLLEAAAIRETKRMGRRVGRRECRPVAGGCAEARLHRD